MRYIVLILLVLHPQNVSRTARQYYEAIYETGGLDHLAAGQVCFDGDPAREDFFIFEQSKYLRQHMAMQGTFQNLPKEMQEHLKNDLLVVRAYHKGIAFNGEQFYAQDGYSWISDFYELDENDSMRIRLTINWQTHGYKRTAEIFDQAMHYQREMARFGKCEDISADVPQTAGPN